VKIRWSVSDGGENWASYNGYVGDRLRFHIVGERFGSKVNGYNLRDFKSPNNYAPFELLREAKKVAQGIVDAESTQ
jgi:hypothetical protein